MSGYDHLLGLAGRLVGARYPERRAEIVATARSAGREQGAWGRLREVASLVALAMTPRRVRPTVREVWLHGAGLAVVFGAVTAIAAAPAFAIVVPFALLACGPLDPRLAAAATLLWLWRLTTIDIADVVHAVGDVSLTGQLARWLLMLVGILVAAHVTRSSTRRAASL